MSRAASVAERTVIRGECWLIPAESRDDDTLNYARSCLIWEIRHNRCFAER
jgi:hypothetical protein